MNIIAWLREQRELERLTNRKFEIILHGAQEINLAPDDREIVARLHNELTQKLSAVQKEIDAVHLRRLLRRAREWGLPTLQVVDTPKMAPKPDNDLGPRAIPEEQTNRTDLCQEQGLADHISRLVEIE